MLVPEGDCPPNRDGVANVGFERGAETLFASCEDKVGVFMVQAVSVSGRFNTGDHSFNFRDDSLRLKDKDSLRQGVNAVVSKSEEALERSIFLSLSGGLGAGEPEIPLETSRSRPWEMKNSSSSSPRDNA